MLVECATAALTMTTPALKITLKNYLFKELSVQRCEQLKLKQRYRNFTIMIMIIMHVKQCYVIITAKTFQSFTGLMPVLVNLIRCLLLLVNDSM